MWFGVSRSLSIISRFVWLLDELSVDEGRSSVEQGDQVGCVEGAPPILGRFDELERHRQARRPGAGSFGDLVSVPYRREG